MKKLSEAGKLYLQDFYILNEAQNDVFVFLDAIMGQVYENLIEGLKDLSDQKAILPGRYGKVEQSRACLTYGLRRKKRSFPLGRVRRISM